MQTPARGIEIFWWCLQRWIYMEARWRDGDMQGGDTLACACLLDLPPLPRKRNGIPMFPRRDLCACVNPKATSRDRSGRGSGVCQVWFLSKRGGSLATPLVPPPTPICSRILMRGQQIEKWLRLSFKLSKITNQAPVWPQCQPKWLIQASSARLF